MYLCLLIRFNLTFFQTGYSKVQKKLYTKPDTLVPLCISMNEWVSGTITVMALYNNYDDRDRPVVTCHPCGTNQGKLEEIHI